MQEIVYGNVRLRLVEDVSGRVEQIGYWPREAVLRPRARPAAAAPMLVGRERQVAAAIQTIDAGIPGRVSASLRLRKSTLLRFLAEHASRQLGVSGVYLQTGELDTVEDMLQQLVGDLARRPEDEPAAATTRFSRVYQGRHELIDHIVVSHSLFARLQQVHILHPAPLPSVSDHPPNAATAAGSGHAPVFAARG